ncbi:MAG: phosphatase PAP2 family protein [Alphaproteobacteria bacterium]|nr:phosphatase PAP2 family protein [Alphaproteobacteria bacterium]
MEASIAIFLSGAREATPNFTQAVIYLADSYLLKGGVLIALLFIAAAPARRRFFSSDNLHIPRTAGAVLISTLVSRMLQLILPHRDRPFTAQVSEYVDAGYVGMSSFPSDHAVLMTTIATAIFIRNRTLGLIAFGWTLAAILAPRIYLGLHHPSDILAGVALGAGICWAVMRAPAPPGFRTWVETLETKYPAPLYLLAFLFAFETARNFGDARAVARMVLDMVA